MRIVNHRISMYRGETPLYTATAQLATGAPYMILTSDTLDYCWEFVVRKAIFSKGDDYIFRKYINIPSTLKRFDSLVVLDYGEADWDNLVGGIENRLYRLSIGGVYEYAYYDTDINEWVDYNFPIYVQFDYDTTKNFEPKVYLYEVNLLGGTLIAPPPAVDTTCPLTVSKKVIILSPTDFKVEGSIGV